MAQISHFRIDRRQLMLGAASLAVAAASSRNARASSEAFVESETGRLRKVLINPAVVADHGGLMYGLDPFCGDAVDDVVAQHADLTAQLAATGAEVLRLEDVLDSAIQEARQRGVWNVWLRATFPEHARAANVRAATLLSRDADARASGALPGLTYVRDFAVMSPQGLVLAAVDLARAREAALFRFMVTYAPAFQNYPVIFDAAAEGLRAEGGDLLVLDAHTLLVGVGNHTDARVAPRLAQATGMNVVAVNIANADQARWSLSHDPLRDFFFHLNTVVAQVAPDHVLALPWLLEAPSAGHANALIAQFGTIERYRAHTGARDNTTAGLKLVDYLRVHGTQVSLIGSRSDEPTRIADQAARKGFIFPARERQAANLLATAPGRLVAFGGADETHATLRAANVQVATVAGPGLWRGYGGAHCLTLPLERA